MSVAKKPLSREERAAAQVQNLREAFAYMTKATNLKLMLLPMAKKVADASEHLGFPYETKDFCTAVESLFFEAKSRVDIHELPLTFPESAMPKPGAQEEEIQPPDPEPEPTAGTN